MAFNLDSSSHVVKRAQEHGKEHDAIEQLGVRTPTDELSFLRNKVEELEIKEKAQKVERDQLRNELQEARCYLKALEVERDQVRNELQGARYYLKEKNEIEEHLRRQLDETVVRLSDVTTELMRTHWAMESGQQQVTEDWRIHRKHINIYKQNSLGGGGWGTVYKGTFRSAPVAVKVLKKISDENLRLFRREMMVAAKCHHPNLLQLMGFSEDQEHRLIMVMELADCSLSEFIEQHKKEGKIGDSGKYLSADIARGLCYLHEKTPPIVHRDIKSENILLKRERDRLTAKIGDYGTAKVSSKEMTPNRGTLIYAAPEAHTVDQQSPKMDVYSFGKVVLQMATYQRPKEGPCSDLIERVKPEGLKKLIVRCTAFKPQGRPTMEEVLVALDHLQ